MKIRAIVSCALLAAACSSDSGEKSNNGASNNGASNNGVTNNVVIDGPVPEADFAQVVATFLCERQIDCECFTTRTATKAECVAVVSQRLAENQEFATNGGLTYDGECVARRMEALVDQGCEPLNAPNNACDPEPCQIFHGANGEGESCLTDDLPIADELSNACAAGLRCANGTCTAVKCSDINDVPDGTECGLIPPGEPTVECRDESVCSAESGVCEPYPVAGEECLGGSNSCLPGLVCRDDGGTLTCQEPATSGTTCTEDWQCDSLSCDDGTCATRTAEGEACTESVRCAEGLGCIDDVCIDVPGVDEECKNAAGEILECESGLFCEPTHCADFPGAVGCGGCDPADKLCLTQVCRAEPRARVCDMFSL